MNLASAIQQCFKIGLEFSASIGHYPFGFHRFSTPRSPQRPLHSVSAPHPGQNRPGHLKSKFLVALVLLLSFTIIGCTNVYPTRDGRLVAVNAGTGYWGYVNSAMEMPLSWNPPPQPLPWTNYPPRPPNWQNSQSTTKNSGDEGRDFPKPKIKAEQESARETVSQSNSPIISY